MSMMVMPMDVIYAHPSDMLAVMARELGGKGFEQWLCIDAVMVLCGGVLTAIVGVTGLLDRLAKDKVVPESLSALSPWGSSYVAILCFSIGSISLFLCIYDPTDPTGIERFGGVFAISFLSVLAAFAFAAILLKLYRPNLARLVITQWWQVVFSFLAVLLGFLGNVVLTPDVFVWFLVYLSALIVIVAYMFFRVEFLGFAIYMVRDSDSFSSYFEV
jgi:amino acid transporter